MTMGIYLLKHASIWTTTSKLVILYLFNLCLQGKADKLEVGLEVEYYVYSREKGGKVSAEGVKVT